MPKPRPADANPDPEQNGGASASHPEDALDAKASDRSGAAQHTRPEPSAAVPSDNPAPSAKAPFALPAETRPQSTLEQRVRRGANDFDFSVLIDGASGNKDAASPHTEARGPGTGEPGTRAASSARPRPSILVGLGILVAVFVAGMVRLALHAPHSTGSGAPLKAASQPSPARMGGSGNTALVRFRLPMDPEIPNATDQVQAPVFILSDFESRQGGWRPDLRLPASRHAVVQRVRNGAQQGSYWLKMDGLTFDPGHAQQAALIVHPDSTDLSHHGSTVSAALFVPKRAPRGMKGLLAIEDSKGHTFWQDNGETLQPGQWTIIRWDAGPLLKDVQQLDVMVNAADQAYSGYVGLDNVQLRDLAGAPDIGDLAATYANGAVRVGESHRFLTQLGVAVCDTDWRIVSPDGTSLRTEMATDHVTTEGTLAVPGDAGTTMPFRETVRIVDDRTLEMSVEATPTKPKQVRAVAVEVLLPKSLYGNASVDMATVSDNVPSLLPLRLGVTAEQARVAGDFPHGFTLRPDAPSVMLVVEDSMPTGFRYLADRPLKAVHLAGAFNNWNTQATPMALGADGRTWTVTVPLTPGEQSYKFVLNDGEWITDPKAVKNVRDSDGNSNSICLVEPPAGNPAARVFHLWIPLSGQTDGAPITLEAGKTLHKTVRLTFNQPFRNALARTDR